MIELIEEIISAENEADEAIRIAKESAAVEKRTAEEALQREIADAKDEAKNEAKRRIDESRSRLISTQPTVSRSSDEATTYLDAHQSITDPLIDEIVTIILSTDIDRQ